MHHVPQGLAADKLHHNVGAHTLICFCLSRIIDGHNVGVVQLGTVLCLHAETLQEGRVPG